MIHDHCVACGQTGNLTQHHLVPRSLGGSDADENLLTLCGSCHAKAHQVQADWRHGELTRSAMQRKKARGECIGSVPYGYRLAENGKSLIPDDAERAAIQQARELRKSGLSLREVAAGLYCQGVRARNGQLYQAEQVRQMLTACFTPTP